MKQMLSVADFSIILQLVNNKIVSMQEIPFVYNPDNKKYEQAKKERIKRLQIDPYYQSLLHLKNSLENLNIEVEVPDIEIKEGVK